LIRFKNVLAQVSTYPHAASATLQVEDPEQPILHSSNHLVHEDLNSHNEII